MQNVVLTGAKRTPIGAFQGVLASRSAVELGAVAMRSAAKSAAAPPEAVDEVHMGCVLPAGLGQAPARQAGRLAGFPDSTPAVTINKMCGSGMQSVIYASDRIAVGRIRIALAGGMESMSNAPYLLPKLRSGARIGHAEVIDHMFLDGLEDAYEKGRLMGSFAEDCAGRFQFTREDQDAFATESLRRASCADFSRELEPVCLRHETIEMDEMPRIAKPERIPHLKPAFRAEGTVTAANSSSISDGAAALVLAAEEEAVARGMPVLARIRGQSTVATQPDQFTIAPVLAAKRLLRELSWKTSAVDLWEVNEAFAVVAMAFIRELGLSAAQVNIRGGACALGHPIGASGARILVTLVHALAESDLKRGVAAICIGGGEATAIALERP
ncbi:MAG: acetyl-CoA C-acyltransferase [Rhodobacteraceae bacterium]|nr:acetyl-CoA C-acyltransferase [Paracoccaceae bacterium]